jgi:flagellar biosynthetic protein FliR
MDPEFGPRLGLLLVRVGALAAVAPGFGSGFAPAMVRAALALLIALTLAPVVAVPPITSPGMLTAAALHETAVGAALGFSVRALTAAFEVAGHLIGFQLGFSYATVVDPQSGAGSSVIAALYGSLALFFFLGLNGHHAVLRALAASYDAAPIGVGGFDGRPLIDAVARIFGHVLTIGLQLAAPVVAALLLVELALGLLTKAAPMLNLMAVGFPVRTAVGLAALALVIHTAPGMVSRTVEAVLAIGARAAVAFR